MSAADKFEGTIYRDLTDAEDALTMARFEARDEPTTARELCAVIDSIDAAVRALHTARTKLVMVAADYNRMVDEKYVLPRLS